MVRISLSAGMVAMVLTALLQWQHGFYTSDLGADPDEPAHAVTSVMVRDYLAEHLGENPIKFAQDYYTRFPKVALGHYPPLYYLVAGVWLLPSRSLAALGLLQAFQLGLLVATSAWVLGRRLPRWLAAAVPLAWSLMPYVQKLAVMVMSDFQVALFCLWSAVAWWRFMETKRLGWSLAFGFLAAAAILTKGSAWSLALVPGLSILAMKDWRLLWNWRLWLAPLPVAALAIPWQLWSSRITERGMTGSTPSQHFAQAVPFYAETLPRVIGSAVAVAVAFALVFVGLRWLRGRRLGLDTAVLWALVLGTLAVVLIIPAGLTSRYLLPLFFPVLIIVVLEIYQLPNARAQMAILILLALCTGLTLPAAYQKNVSGFGLALWKMEAQSPQDPDLRMLAISDARGEGAFVAAAAFDDAADRKRATVLRGSKELSEQDWMGRGFVAKAATPAAVLDLLNRRQIDWVALDLSAPADYSASVHTLLAQTLAQPDSGWLRLASQPVTRDLGQGGTVELYTRKIPLALERGAANPLPNPAFKP